MPAIKTLRHGHATGEAFESIIHGSFFAAPRRTFDFVVNMISQGPNGRHRPHDDLRRITQHIIPPSLCSN